MSGESAIEWTDRVWNPVTGCTRVSAGCDHCYAFALHDRRYVTNRNAAIDNILWKRGSSVSPYPPEQVRADGGKLPHPAQYDVPFSRVQVLDERRLTEPLRWRKPQRVFVNSMGDLFHADVPDEAIDRVFAVMALAPQHTFQLLTKRPERMREYLAGADEDGEPLPLWYRSEAVQDAAVSIPEWPETYANGLLQNGAWPLPNVWLGVSVEDQATADERIPLLLGTPAAVRFVSYEPALGPIDFKAFQPFRMKADWIDEDGRDTSSFRRVRGILGGHLSWVIVGGESGAGARPFDLAWARSVIAQCRAAGVACFVKQFGSACFSDTERICGANRDSSLPSKAGDGLYRRMRDRHGGDPSEWPADLRVREMPR